MKVTKTECLNKTLVILNPAARSERAGGLLTRIETITDGCIVTTTAAAGEAEHVARNGVAEGFETIVAAGGDGTVNEIVNGLAGSEATLGILPIGTVNVFAAQLGLPVNDLAACWRIILSEHTRRIDVATANGKCFVQLAGVGLDAQAVKETTDVLKRNFGPLSYIISAAAIATRKPPRLEIDCAEASSSEASFVLVGNGRLYGGPFPFFKEAQMDDGLLDVVLFHRIGPLEIIRYLQDVFFSKEISAPDVEYLQTRRLRVTSDEEVPVELDGELVGSCPVEFRIDDHTLRVLVPV